ncbi:MAG: M20/M25/M40 family metallo-hydrolase [Gemmatimonadetes bacterium]|nr:M20/M25/M40 family metallo-hydrolase [Gemmatimonadota bacterium]
MRVPFSILATGLVAVIASSLPAQGAPAAADSTDPIKSMVAQLDLERYKATIKGLTQFGDRRQGTDRNQAAVEWIEKQLKSYGCADVERLTYDFQPPAPRAGGAGAAGAAGAAGRAGGAGAAGGRGGAPLVAQGGGRPRGMRTRTGVNNDSLAQTDPKLRALNAQPTTPGKRQEVVCTKVGSTHPEEMYIVGAHMDGHGWGEAANDDGSGTAIVMELARIFSNPEVRTERTIRFALWNNEETGLNGARAYIDQRQALQGKESPAGSGKYPEPKWLGMIQHDMMLFDHGMPNPDGTIPKEQRPEADVNVEFQVASKMVSGSQALAWVLHAANEKYATDYPASVGSHMTNTDSGPFQDIVPSVSLRENERGAQIGNGWDPHWHQVTDMFSTFSDKDFRLGLNAAQTTLGALGQLTGATIVKK